uniref:Uncharacterized protein n=1 Tax=Rhabditophanes sp. KR3021 TaxID=114890 RepID=A0AC35TZA9_9BILA
MPVSKKVNGKMSNKNINKGAAKQFPQSSNQKTEGNCNSPLVQAMFGGIFHGPLPDRRPIEAIFGRQLSNILEEYEEAQRKYIQEEIEASQRLHRKIYQSEYDYYIAVNAIKDAIILKQNEILMNPDFKNNHADFYEKGIAIFSDYDKEIAALKLKLTETLAETMKLTARK